MKTKTKVAARISFFQSERRVLVSEMKMET